MADNVNYASETKIIQTHITGKLFASDIIF